MRDIVLRDDDDDVEVDDEDDEDGDYLRSGDHGSLSNDENSRSTVSDEVDSFGEEQEEADVENAGDMDYDSVHEDVEGNNLALDERTVDEEDVTEGEEFLNVNSGEKSSGIEVVSEVREIGEGTQVGMAADISDVGGTEGLPVDIFGAGNVDADLEGVGRTLGEFPGGKNVEKMHVEIRNCSVVLKRIEVDVVRSESSTMDFLPPPESPGRLPSDRTERKLVVALEVSWF
jgi:hypothetical protein